MKYFLGHRFDEHDRTLWRGTDEVRLTRKAAAVLHCLMERAGTIVSRDAILTTVWPATFVHADNVKVLVHEIRVALNDDPREPHFIRNEPGAGYTFVAPVKDAPILPPEFRDSAATSIFVNDEARSRLASALDDEARGDGRVFLVDAERGMGKTALCAEFMKLARTRPSTYVCYGQSFAHVGPAEPYLPIVDALHHLARQLPTTIPGLLALHAPTWLARMPRWVIDAAPRVGVPLSADPSRMIHEISSLLKGLAIEVATVIVLDDLQWADLETVELLRALSRRHTPLRAAILGAYTPFDSTLTSAALRNLSAELRAAGRSWSMTLGPLNEAQVRTYLLQRFGGPSTATLARMLHRISGGNPLVMVSTMDALIAAGFVVMNGEGWRLRHSAHTTERSLPDTALNAILWRFDQLAIEDRVVLEFAAAVGTEFLVSDVARAAGAESPLPIRRRLDALCFRGFIARLGPKVSNELAATGAYRFWHPLHTQLLAGHAPVFDHLRAVERLAFDRSSTQQFG
jgi:DNA-binding winged helix-turn-helix (wHTH) protein